MSRNNSNTTDKAQLAHSAEGEEGLHLPKSLHRQYTQIGSYQRQQLLLALEESRSSIKSVACRLGINYSTAKNIVKIYRKENRIDKLPKHPAVSRRAFRFVQGNFKCVTCVDERKNETSLPRFIARKCPLFVKETLGAEPRRKEGSPESVGKDCATRHTLDASQDSIPRPVFDFQAYTQIILEMYVHALKGIGRRQTGRRVRVQAWRRSKEESCPRPSRGIYKHTLLTTIITFSVDMQLGLLYIILFIPTLLQ